MKAIAPGKLILSGEHSVVYGKPALAMAIDRYAESTLKETPDLDRVSFHLQDLEASGQSYTLMMLREFSKRVQKNYRQFLEGNLGIREVLKKPVDLFGFAFIMVLDGLHLKLQQGLDVSLHSTIPIGCGLGSSAATALSTLRAVGHYFRVDFKPEWYMEYSLETEKMQHGYPSGVDSYMSLYGGCARFQDGRATSVPMPGNVLYLANTGTPESSTGECVEEVRRQHEADHIWQDFESVTDMMEQSIRDKNAGELREAIRHNHSLLCRIGVVPERIQAFISEIEERGGAGKVCGAGSVKGDTAGMVLVHCEESLKDLYQKYGMESMAVRGDPLGARVI